MSGRPGMFDKRDLIALYQAYIFKELYTRGFIKSKTFTVADDVSYLGNKIMHILKTSVQHSIAAMEEGDLKNHISGVSFMKNSLIINLNRTRPKNALYESVVAAYNQAVKNTFPVLFPGNFFGFDYYVYQNSIMYTFAYAQLNKIFAENSIATLTNAVNCIINVKSHFMDIIKEIYELTEITEANYSLYHLSILSFSRYWVTEPDANIDPEFLIAIVRLEYLYRNHPIVLKDIMYTEGFAPGGTYYSIQWKDVLKVKIMEKEEDINRLYEQYYRHDEA